MDIDGALCGSSDCNIKIEIKIQVLKKRIVILGAGESGIGTAILAKKEGYEVFVSDGGKIQENYKTDLLNNGITFEEGTHSADKILNAATVMKSPGIPESNEMVKK